ncbi:Armadillo-type fold [Sesbania bispinosa]|nr:Armadillo-type fold [Sesbania bispinosa]
MTERDGGCDFHLRTLSISARDSNTANDPASDPSLLQSVKKLHELCKAENSEHLVARVYPHINKIFQRAVASLSQSRTSNGLLLLAILQFYLDFGEVVLHDADPSLRTFFRSCLSREFADPVVAEAMLEFLITNKKKLLMSFPNLLPQFFPLLLKLIAWNGERTTMLDEKPIDGSTLIARKTSKLGSSKPRREKPWCTYYKRTCHTWENCFKLHGKEQVLSQTGGLKGIQQSQAMPLSQLLHPQRSLASFGSGIGKGGKSSGPLIGSSIASIQKNTAPKMLLALMDEAYTGSTIEDGGGDSESEDSGAIDVADPFFLELLKDENDGIAERPWSSPVMAAILQTAVNSPYSDRLKAVLSMAPRLLDVYFSVALRDVNDWTPSSNQLRIWVRKRLLEFMPLYSSTLPKLHCPLKKPIMDRLGEAYDSPDKTELALQLCWAIGEHGGGGGSHKDEARELFESLELLLYENLSSSHLGMTQEVSLSSDNETYRRVITVQALCFVVTAIAKLATHHRELLPRARVSLGKVARSRISDTRVWRRACDFLGLMKDPAICSSILGPSRSSQGTTQRIGSINWNDGATKMIAHIPFYILGEQEGEG